MQSIYIRKEKEEKIMKKNILFFIIFILLSSSAFALFDNPLSVLDVSGLRNITLNIDIQNKEKVFCLQGGNCSINELHVNNSYEVNETVVNKNITNTLNVYGISNFYDKIYLGDYICELGGSCYSLSELNSTPDLSEYLKNDTDAHFNNFYMTNAPVECPDGYYMTRWNGSESVCVLDDDTLGNLTANVSKINNSYYLDFYFI